MEPRGGKNRIRARKMTQDSARQLPRAVMVAQTRLWWNSGVPKWRPKSTKIDEKNIEKSFTFLIAFRIDFSSFLKETSPENDRNIASDMMKKTSRRKTVKK